MAKETLSAHELNKYTYCPYRQYRLRQILWKILILAVFVLILVYWVMQYVHV